MEDVEEVEDVEKVEEAYEQRTLRPQRLEKQLNTVWRTPGGNKMYATITEGMIKLKLRTIREKHRTLQSGRACVCVRPPILPCCTPSPPIH